MAQRFYDTKTAQIRDFKPLVPGEVSLYYCGATVQGKPHVGHVRSAIVFDILYRWLESQGHRVTMVRNVTDVDDKILQRAAESEQSDFTPTPDYPANETWFGLAYRFEQAFHRAYDALGVARPTYEPRATGHIPEMLQLIQRLIDAGHAYPAIDGSADVYFDVTSWPSYGALTHQSADDMQDAADADPRGKKDVRDFALWKGQSETDPDTAAWDSPWGPGRPGWHVECSAMSTKYLGSAFDIHGGGLDLRFPHHENELAQSTAAGDDFANFWMHNGMVTYEGQKMSKSVGNTVSPEQMLAQARPIAVRYFLGQAHYRSQLDYKPTSLQEAQAAVERIESFQERVAKRFGEIEHSAQDLPESFITAMEDDLNVPQALAALHESVRSGNTALSESRDDDAATAARQVNAMMDVLGLSELENLGGNNTAASQHTEVLDRLVSEQIAARAQARADKDWATADAIRDSLAAAGVILEDTAEGVTWSVRTP